MPLQLPTNRQLQLLRLTPKQNQFHSIHIEQLSCQTQKGFNPLDFLH